MRVIAGDYKGRNLKAPQGTNTRPTTDRVRESLFSSLNSARGGFGGAVVLDAFAGSGALGIEALSRGAAFACLCERDRAALQALEANTSFLEAGTFRIVRADVEKQLPPAPPTSCSPAAAFDLVLLDPPYAFSVAQVCALLERLQAAKLIAPDALLSYEHAAALDPTSENAWHGLQWQHLQTRSYGDTALSLFRKED